VQRLGISAVSHKVITKLILDACEAARCRNITARFRFAHRRRPRRAGLWRGI